MKGMIRETLGEEGVKSPIIPKGETMKIDPQERGVYKVKRRKRGAKCRTIQA